MSAVAVLLLNWRQYERTAACLESIYALEAPPTPSIYLIDNESDPSALKALLAKHPSVIPIPLEANLGFAGGMNAGIKRALADGADYVVLLNNDTFLTPPVICQLIALFENKHLKVGIAGPSLRTLPPESKVEAIGLEVNRWSGRITLRHNGVSPEDLYPYPHQVDALSGACMMISREVIEEVGTLDDGYFFYFEDVDLCLRARDKGWNVYASPTAVVYHEGGASMGDHPDRAYYGVRNQLKVIAERGLDVSSPIALGRSLYIAALNLARLKNEGDLPSPKHLKGFIQGVRDHRRRHYGPRGDATQ